MRWGQVAAVGMRAGMVGEAAGSWGGSVGEGEGNCGWLRMVVLAVAVEKLVLDEVEGKVILG